MSKSHDIGEAIVTALQSLTFEVSTGPTVNLSDSAIVLRKVAELPQRQNPPQIMVAVTDEQRTRRLTAQLKQTYYTALVVIVTARGNKLQDDERIRTWRDQITAKLYDTQGATFTALDGFDEVKYNPRVPFDATLLGKDLCVSVQAFEFEMIETMA